MAEKVLNAGDEVDSYCTACKLVLAHQVVAAVEGVVDKVICKTCKKTHKYRPKPPKVKAAETSIPGEGKEAKPKKAPVRTKKAKELANKWEELSVKRSMAQARPYSMQESFELDDMLTHEKFGIGFVTKVRSEGKMEVLFKDGPKLLVYGRI